MKKTIFIFLPIVALATLIAATILFQKKNSSELSRGRAHYFKDGVVVVDEINSPMSFYVIKCDPDQIKRIRMDAYNIHVDLKLAGAQKRGFSAGSGSKRITIVTVDSDDVSAKHFDKSPELIKNKLPQNTRALSIVGLIDDLER